MMICEHSVLSDLAHKHIPDKLLFTPFPFHSKKQGPEIRFATELVGNKIVSLAEFQLWTSSLESTFSTGSNITVLKRNISEGNESGRSLKLSGILGTLCSPTIRENSHLHEH